MPLLAAVAASIVGLGACASEPGARTVAEELIETLESVPGAQRACLREVLDSYSSDELDAIANQNENFDGSPESLEAATPEMREFLDKLSACDPETRATTDAGPTATTDAGTATTDAGTTVTTEAERATSTE